MAETLPKRHHRFELIRPYMDGDAYGRLKRAGIGTIGELADKYEGESLEALPGVGSGTVFEVRWALRRVGLIQ